MCRDEPVRLTPEQWRATAEFISGIAEILCDILPEKEKDGTAKDVRRIAGYAAAACVYVGEFAANECAFKISDIKEGEHGSDD